MPSRTPDHPPSRRRPFKPPASIDSRVAAPLPPAPSLRSPISVDPRVWTFLQTLSRATDRRTSRFPWASRSSSPRAPTPRLNSRGAHAMRRRAHSADARARGTARGREKKIIPITRAPTRIENDRSSERVRTRATPRASARDDRPTDRTRGRRSDRARGVHITPHRTLESYWKSMRGITHTVDRLS